MSSARRDAPAPGSGEPTRHLEVETKLDIDPGAELTDLPRSRAVRSAGMSGWTDPVTHELDATYFDTADLDLLGARVTLRRRTGGTDAGWHLKLPAGSGARTEIALPLEPVGHPAIVPGPLAALVTGAARGRELQPVARITNHRTVRRLVDSDGRELVEIADDRVTAVALDAAGAASGSPHDWRELEAELIDGTRDQLAAAVAGLRKAGAATASSASKLARALAADPEPTRSGARKKDRSAGAAVLAATRRLRDTLIAADLTLRSGTVEPPASMDADTSHPEATGVATARYDSRSTARRIRAVLTVFAPVFDPEVPPELLDRLRRHGQVLSPGRDLDAVAARLTTQLAEEPVGFSGPAISRLDAEVQRRRTVDSRTLREYLDSDGYLELLRDLDGFLRGPDWSRSGERTAGTVLPAALVAPWARLGRSAESISHHPDDPQAVHRVRKQAAALRYAAEAVAPVLGENTVVFAAAVEELQEVLGEYTDAVTAAAFLAEIARSKGTSGAAGFIFGRMHAFEQAAAQAALDDFTDAWLRLADGELFTAVTGEKNS